MPLDVEVVGTGVADEFGGVFRGVKLVGLFF